MKNKKQAGKIILIIILLIFFISGGLLLFFCLSEKEEVEIEIGELQISAGVVPHHLLAEKLIREFFEELSSDRQPETVVLLGPDHFSAGKVLGNNFITVQPEGQSGGRPGEPAGSQRFYELEIDGRLIKGLGLRTNIVFGDSSVNSDHGITGLMPFIKDYFPDVKIVPFIIPENISLEQSEQFVEGLSFLAPRRTIVIASVDFSHYLSPTAAAFHDVKSIRTLLNFEIESFEGLEVDSWQSLYIARAFARLRAKESAAIIGHYQSIDFLEQENQDQEMTSYFSVVFEQGDKGQPKEIKESQAWTILFVGDIMLDRGVEYLIKKNSVHYPFQKINQFLRGIDVVFGNLEGPIVKKPTQFSSKSLKFAFPETVIPGLVFANFDVFSLANNHSLNMGWAGLEETRELLKGVEIAPIGDPLDCSVDFLFEREDIIFLAFNITYPESCRDEKIIKTIKAVRAANPKDFLIISMHWGEEYEHKSSSLQNDLAHKIIDSGADLIIGHHSHVVQNIEKYNGKLIFYSLGNFVFDQYFSQATQQGLAVGLEIYSQRLVYRIFPIKSRLAQPFLMGQTEVEEFLERLAAKSSPGLSEGIKNGKIEINK